MTQVIVDLPTGERLVVHRLNDRLDGDEVQAGDRIVLHWAAEHSFVIPATPALAGERDDHRGRTRMTEPIEAFPTRVPRARRWPRPRASPSPGPRRSQARAPRRRRSSSTTGPTTRRTSPASRRSSRSTACPSTSRSTPTRPSSRAPPRARSRSTSRTPASPTPQDWAGAGLIGPVDTKKFTAWKSVNKELAEAGHVQRQAPPRPVGLGLLDAHVPRRQVRAVVAVVGGDPVRQEAAQQGHDVRRGRRHHQDRRADERPSRTSTR